MSLSLIVAALWVLGATFTAMLAMRHQYIPGVTLLIAAPAILIWIAVDHGMWVALACVAAVLSMMRNPLKYLLRRLMGEKPEIPK